MLDFARRLARWESKRWAGGVWRGLGSWRGLVQSSPLFLSVDQGFVMREGEVGDAPPCIPRDETRLVGIIDGDVPTDIIGQAFVFLIGVFLENFPPSEFGPLSLADENAIVISFESLHVALGFFANGMDDAAHAVRLQEAKALGLDEGGSDVDDEVGAKIAQPFSWVVEICPPVPKKISAVLGRGPAGC